MHDQSFDSLGNLDLLQRPLLAVFGSTRCPARLILRAHDYAKAVRDGTTGFIGGFHSPVEREVLEVLLKGACPLVIVLGRRLQGARLPAAWRAEIATGRLLVVSPFKSYQRRVTQETAHLRNDLAAHLAQSVLIIHASEGGALQRQAAAWQAQGKPVRFLEHESIPSL